MKEVLGLLAMLIMLAILYGVIQESGYKNGYKQGQIDAMDGKIMFVKDTAKTIYYKELK